jgi:hypothetical protein
MTAGSYARLAAGIFAVIAILQLLRAVLGWPVTVDTAWGPMSVPLWPNWVAFAAFGLLAWLGFTAPRA